MRFNDRTTLPVLVGALAGVLTIAEPSWGDLQLQVTAGPGPARPSELLDIELTVTNDGPFDRTDVTLELIYPVNAASIFDTLIDGDCPSTTCDPGEIVTFPIPTIPAGGGRTFSLPIRVNAAATDGSELVFNATVFDDGELQTSSETLLTVDSTRELNLILVERNDPALPGAPVTYTLMYGVANTSPGSPGATLSVPIPAGTTFVSASHGGVVVDSMVEWDLGNLNPGSTGERTVVFDVNRGVDEGSIIPVEATFEDTLGNTVSYETATRAEQATPLELAIVASPDPARAGELLDLEITATNSGPLDRSGVEIRLEVPHEVGFMFDTLFDGDCPSTTCDPQERALISIGTLAAGEGKTFSIPFRALAAATDGTTTRFEADIRDSTGELREAGTGLVIDSTRELELALTESRDPASAGDEIAYTLTWGLIDTSPGAPAAMLRFTPPGGTSLIDTTGGGTMVNGMIEWSLGALNPGANGEVVARFAVDDGADAGTILPASAMLTDSTAGVSRSETAGRVQDTLPLELDIIASPDPVRPGETMEVEITLTNTGVFDRTGVIVSLEYPEDMAFLFDTLIFGGECPSTTCDTQETTVFDLGTLPAGEGRTFSLPLRASDAASDGTVMSLEARVIDSTGDQRLAGDSIVIDSSRELNLALVEADEPAAAGTTLMYTLMYGGDVAGNGVASPVLSFTPPIGTSVDFISDGGTLVDGRVEWTLPPMNPGATGSRLVSVAIDGGQSDGDILGAVAEFFDDNDTHGRVRFEDTTRIETDAPFDVELSLGSLAALPGDQINVEVAITNTTAFDRTDITLIFEWPDALAFLFDSTFDGDCPSTTCDPRERATFTIPLIAAGETLAFPIEPSISVNAPIGSIVNFDASATDTTGYLANDGDSIAVSDDFDPAVNGDLDGNGVIDITDLLIVLAEWGPCGDPDDCVSDFNGDGEVDITDLLVVLGNWI